jgi:radical SAM superfamily enzyme YgiQ (UPF0313 family)
MPDIAGLTIHQSAAHMPNLGIASIGANIDPEHDVYIIDLIRKRNKVKSYITKCLKKIKPDLIGLSSMTWQWDTCFKIIKIIKSILPEVKIAAGGYHPTLLYEEMGKNSEEKKYLDYIIRGEGEIAFKALVNAIDKNEPLNNILSLSFKDKNGEFVHNKQGDILDLNSIKRPIRDKRRLTWGYHILFSKIEVLEASRGCTRSCNFCCMHHMYGKTFRHFPIKRIIEDLNEIYYSKKTKWAFFTDDNITLNPQKLIELCDAIIGEKKKGKLKKLKLLVQAECLTIAKNEALVKKMSEAGFCGVFLGIENISKANLQIMQKGDIVEYTKTAVANCKKYGIVVSGGLIFGLPEDDEETIKDNYEFARSLNIDRVFYQVMTPYPKTGIRAYLESEGLITNHDDLKWYDGMWANIKTKKLDSDKLHYYYWLHRVKTLGWWNPSDATKAQFPKFVKFWKLILKPLLMRSFKKKLKKYGWEGLYDIECNRLKKINEFNLD